MVESFGTLQSYGQQSVLWLNALLEFELFVQQSLKVSRMEIAVSLGDLLQCFLKEQDVFMFQLEPARHQFLAMADHSYCFQFLSPVKSS